MSLLVLPSRLVSGVGQPDADRLRALVAERGLVGAAAWLDQVLAGLTLDALGSVRVALARCSRKVGNAALPYAGWTARDAARAVIVLRAFEVSEDPASDYGRWLRRGEQGEQESLLRMLPLLPGPEPLVPHAIEACRTNSEVVFRAIACANPFPAAYFPVLHFNQLVLKAVFLGVPVAQILGLERRVTDELLRMADDFAAERTAASRPVPDDLALLHRIAER